MKKSSNQLKRMITLFVFFLIFCSNNAFAIYLSVTNTNDSGNGSLRNAITIANQDITQSYTISLSLNDGATINLFSPLPTILGSAYISPANYGDTIFISGQNMLSGPGVRSLVVEYLPSHSVKFVNFLSATFTVTNTNLNGLGSLKQAIIDANTTPEKDYIRFNISGSAPHIISFNNTGNQFELPLPYLITPISIDGTTQPANGYLGSSPKIILDGTNVINIQVALIFDGTNSEVYGLNIRNFYDEAIRLGQYKSPSNITIGAPNKGNLISGNGVGITIPNYATNILIQNNLIGTNESGTASNPNSLGISVFQAMNLTIKNNLISGNSSSGVYATSTVTNFIIQGNKIGTDITGSFAIKNNNYGIKIWYGNTVFIGGTGLGQGNLISGNGTGSYDAGVGFFGNTNTVSILGNLIGTNLSGNSAIPNINGILVQDSIFNFSIGNGISSGRNIVSGNTKSGIFIKANEHVVINNNYIGTDISGENAIPNNEYGLALSNNTNGDIFNNLISGNLRHGLFLDLYSKSNNVFKNIIGTNINKNKNLGNGFSGVKISNFSSLQDNKIGNSDPSNSNIIAFNHYYGIDIEQQNPPSSNYNLLSYNSIYGNLNKGILLRAWAGQTHPKPIINSISSNQINGITEPNDSVQIYYSQLTDLFPQGKTFIATVLADANGLWTYNGSINTDSIVTCNAVNPLTNYSSEFADVCLPAVSNFGYSITDFDVSFVDSSLRGTDYYWDFGDGSNDTVSNPTHAYSNMGTYLTTLIVSNSCGSDTLTQTITICSPVIANASDSINGLDVQFTDSSLYASTYYWDFGDGNTDTIASPNHTFTEIGTYQVSLIVSNSCGSDTLIQTVAVCTSPTANLSDSINNLDVYFTNNSLHATSYYWDFGDGIMDTILNPSHTYNSIGSFDVTLIVSNFCGSDTIIQTITVCTSPIANLVYSQTGLNTQFTGTSQYGTSYYWNFGDGNMSTLENPSYSFAENGTYLVSLIVSNNCGSDTISQSINVCTPPIANATYTANDLNIQFTNNSSNALNYIWDFGDDNTSILQNPNHTYSSIGTYSVILIVTNDCGSDTLIQEVEICTQTLANFSSTTNDLTAQFTNGSSNEVDYFWDFGDGSTSILENPTHTFLTMGVYAVTLVVSNSCISDTIIQMVTVCLQPLANFTFNVNNSIVQFTNTSSNGSTYLWNFDDGFLSTNENPTHTFNENDTFNVQLIATNLCGVDTSFQQVIVDNHLSVVDLAKIKLLVYPNPVTEIIKIDIEDLRPNLVFKIYDILGREIKSKSLTENQTIIERGEINSGNYIYKIIENSQIISTGKLNFN